MHWRRFATSLILTVISVDVAAYDELKGEPKKIEVHAHRGGRALFPESSLMAYRRSIEMGVDYVECDLRVTKDNVVVISHDENINNKTCVGPKGESLGDQVILIRDLTLEELKQYSCGKVPHPEFPNQKTCADGDEECSRFATLDELLDLLAKQPKKIGLDIEFKSKPKGHVPAPEIFTAFVVPKVHAKGLIDQIHYFSFTSAYVDAAEALSMKLGRSAKFNVTAPKHTWMNVITVKALRGLGYKVVPWTPNEPQEWEKLIGLGEDGIITDDPQGLIDYLNAKQN